MVFGLGTNKVQKESAKGKQKQSSTQSQEAAEILKKIEAKKDDGECAFC